MSNDDEGYVNPDLEAHDAETEDVVIDGDDGASERERRLKQLAETVVADFAKDTVLQQRVEVPGANGAILKGWPTTNVVKLYVYGPGSDSVMVEFKRLMTGTERGDNSTTTFRHQVRIQPKYDEDNNLISLTVVGSELSVTLSPDTYDEIVRRGLAMQLAMAMMVSPTAAIRERRRFYQNRGRK